MHIVPTKCLFCFVLFCFILDHAVSAMSYIYIVLAPYFSLQKLSFKTMNAPLK